MKKIKIYKIFVGIIVTLLITMSTLSIYSLCLLANIETFYRIMAIILFILITIILVYSLLHGIKHNKKKKMLISSILSTLTIIINGIISIIILTTYFSLDTINKDSIQYETILISLKDYKNIDKIKDLKIGILSDEEDITGNILPNEVIKKYSLSKDNEIIKYSDSISLMSSILNKEVDLIFISDNYKSMFTNLNEYDEQTKIYEIYSYKKEYKKNKIEKDYISTGKNITEPFTMLLLGIDSDKDGIEASSFNGDSIMMITFDPKTLNATMFSIPRDTYVTMACGGKITKINHASWGGTNCMVKTVEKLTGIEIDYYAKINFKGVVDLVDNIGGVEVNVPIEFCEQNSDREFGSSTICLKPGLQKLNGEQALAFARHRKTLPMGDFQRGQHQQMLIEGMIQSVKKLRSVEDFLKILETVSRNLDTNMKTEEMLSFYNVAKDLVLKSEDVNLNITKTYLTGYDLMVYTGSNYSYTFQYYKQSLNDIINAMKINLGQKEKEEIKTFNFNLNNLYEKEIIGQKYYNEPKKPLMPNLSNYTVEEAKTWASNNGIELIIDEQISELPNGFIISQSIHEGVLVESISEKVIITVSIRDVETIIPEENETTEETSPESIENEES